ncbi:hypothetical protein B6U74_03550 [Candidatus Bathyarchaeota archaeon ex4484_205]|nr:MAG: hypothetical protein B6U74_03550 [Candidatus Bathyarchaeota archaeon ex4484_205]
MREITVKKEIRIIGIDDGPFRLHEDRYAILIGVVMRGTYGIEGYEYRWIEVDGLDATDKAVEMIVNSKFMGEIRVILLSGITYAGFNMIHPLELMERTSLPVIVVSEKKPDYESMRKAMIRLKNSERRMDILREVMEPKEIRMRNKKLYIQPYGISIEKAEEILEKSMWRGGLPEALRLAHITGRLVFEACEERFKLGLKSDK